MHDKANKLHAAGYAVIIAGFFSVAGFAVLTHIYNEYAVQLFRAGVAAGAAVVTAGTVLFFKGGPYKTPSLAITVVTALFSVGILAFYIMPSFWKGTGQEASTQRLPRSGPLWRSCTCQYSIP